MPKRPRRRRQDLILDHLIALTNAEIQRFLKRHKIPGASANAKDQLRGVLRQALEANTITTEAVVAFLDEVTPWGKQHVYLYKGPPSKDWRDQTWVAAYLKSHKVDHLVDARTDAIVLPKELQLASINSSTTRLRVTAIRRREGWVRNEEYDNTSKKAPDGRPLWLKAFVYEVLRGIVAFEWNLISNEAFLQITQLPSGGNYESVTDEFTKLVEPWLDLKSFKLINLRHALKRLHELEESGKAAAESHAADFSRLGQRRIALRSTSTKVPLRGDIVLDGMLKILWKDGIPRMGDFFFKEDGGVAAKDGKSESRAHVIIMAEKGRVNFVTPYTEDGIRNVLTKLRKLSS
jgi:hypothetical protein